MSANSVMVARIMLDNGYKLESGLGRNLQGRLDPIEVKDKKDTYGLGYTPTREDRRKFFAQKRRRMLNSQGKAGRKNPLQYRSLEPPISESFTKTTDVVGPFSYSFFVTSWKSRRGFSDWTEREGTHFGFYIGGGEAVRGGSGKSLLPSSPTAATLSSNTLSTGVALLDASDQ